MVTAMIAAGQDTGARTPRESRRLGAMHVLLQQGARVLDATGGDGRLVLGHDRNRIADAVRAAPSGPASHSDLAKLRQRIAALMPPRLDEVSFTTCGAQTAARAIAMAWAHHRHQPERQRILVCSQRPAADLLPAPFDPRDMFVGRDLAGIMAQVTALGLDHIAALLIEPLGLADGLTPLSATEVEGLRQLCERSGILLIADETVAGLGRLGAPLASQRLGLTPDLVMLGEMLTNDAAPLGAVVARADMAELLMESDIVPDAGAVAGALETLATLDEENLLRHCLEIEPYWQQAIHSLAGAPVIDDIRCLGLAAAITLAPRTGAPGARGQLLFQRARDYGVLTRVLGDTLLLTPALVITRDQIDEIVEKLSAALRKII